MSRSTPGTGRTCLQQHLMEDKQKNLGQSIVSPPKNAREKKEKLKKKERQCEKQSAVLQTIVKKL